MILDLEAILSDDQAVTSGTTDSTNVIELPRRSYPGQPMRLLIQVTTDFTGGTSIAFDLETDTVAAMSSPDDIATVTAVVTATLVAGYTVNIPFVPRDNQEFISLEYTVVGTMTAGNFTAGIIFDEQTNKTLYPPA